MKKKKQMKIILAMVVVIAILLGGWVMMKSSGLSAEEIQKPQEEVTGENDIPEPPNPNAINVQDNFYFVDKNGLGAELVPNWTNTVRMFSEKPDSMGALWYKDTISLKKDFEGDFAIYFGKQERVAYDGVTLTFQNAEGMEDDPTKVIGYKGAGLGVSGSDERPDYVKAVTPAISVAFNPGINYNWDSNTLENNKKKPTVSLAIPYQDDVTLLYFHDNESAERGKNPNYNVQYSVAEKPWLNNGEWLKVSFKWNKDDQTFSYRVGKFLDDDDAQTEFQFTDMGEWQTVQFGTGETNGTVVPGDAGQTITKLKETAEEYFGGKNIYWGFTGANIIANYPQAEDFKINPVVSIGKTPNQSQSPLQLSMQKLGEIDPTTGERAPLEGAKFILQAQDADGTWRQFNPEEGTTKDVAEVFTTDKEGKIVIKATDGGKSADIIDLVLQYGGTYNGEPATEEHPSNYAAFRFREVNAAGDAYIAPPAIDPKDPTNYAASEPANSAALFTTKSVKLSGASTTEDGDFGTVYNSNQNWLPYYQPNPALEGTIGSGGWLDSMTSYIPRDSVFTMMWNENSKLVEWSDSVSTEKDLSKLPKGKKNGATPPYDEEIPDSVVIPTNNTEPKWFRFENVGFHDGKPVGVKITVQPKKAINPIYEGLSYIRYGQEYFLRVTMMAGTGSPTVHYQFLDENGKPLQDGLSGYSVLGPINYHSSLKLPINEIKNVYSVNRQFSFDQEDYPTLVKYQVENDLLDLTSDIPVPSTPGVGWYKNEIQTKATRTFPKTSDLTVNLYETKQYSPADYSAQAIFFNPDTDVKVEIPNPQSTNYTYSEIIDSDNFKGIVNDLIKPLNYGFIQQMPWEGVNEAFGINNRTQTPTWTLTSPVANTTLVAKDWEVVPLDNPTKDTATLFDFTGINAAGNGSILPTSDALKEAEFYNHYYEFERKLEIKYENPILKNQIEYNPTDKKYYFDFAGDVSLEVKDSDQKAGQETMNGDRGPAPKYDTAINFYAPITYTYLDENIYNTTYTEAYAKALEEAGVTEGTVPTDEQKDAATVVAKTAAKTAAKIKDDDLADGIVTWNAPLTPMKYEDYEDDGSIPPGKQSAPKIDGYEYVENSATLNGQSDNFQVKVTKLLKDGVEEKDAKATDYEVDNEVVLFYRQNAMTLTTSGDIYFKQTAVPLGASKAIIPRAITKEEAGGAVTSSTEESTESSTGESTSSTSDAGFSNEKNGTDWSITVSGGLPSAKTGYSVSATLKEPFNNGSQGGSLSDVLVFKEKGGAATNGTTIPLTADTEAENSTVKPITLFEENPANNPVPYTKTMKWGAEEGFLLDLSYTKSLDVWFNMTSDSSGKKKPTVYKGEIELSLNYLP